MSEPRTWNLSPKMWMSSNSASVSDLLEELSTLTDLERELVSKLHSLREDRSKLTLRLMTLVDQNPMLVSTPQQKVWACPKGKARILTLPNLDALAQFFFEAGAAVSPGQKREVASYLRFIDIWIWFPSIFAYE